MNDVQRLELAEVAERFAALLRASLGHGAESAPACGDLSVAQLGMRLGRSPSTVRGWLEGGRFPGAYKLPGDPRHAAWRIPETAVEAFRNRGTGTQAISEWRKRRKSA